MAQDTFRVKMEDGRTFRFRADFEQSRDKIFITQSGGDHGWRDTDFQVADIHHNVQHAAKRFAMMLNLTSKIAEVERVTE